MVSNRQVALVAVFQIVLLSSAWWAQAYSEGAMAQLVNLCSNIEVRTLASNVNDWQGYGPKAKRAAVWFGPRMGKRDPSYDGVEEESVNSEELLLGNIHALLKRELDEKLGPDSQYIVYLVNGEKRMRRISGYNSTTNDPFLTFLSHRTPKQVHDPAYGPRVGRTVLGTANGQTADGTPNGQEDLNLSVGPLEPFLEFSENSLSLHTLAMTGILKTLWKIAHQMVVLGKLLELLSHRHCSSNVLLNSMVLLLTS